MGSLERRRVVIVGAGIAGMALACSLDPSRVDVVLAEAQPERMTGAALGVWPDARMALTRLGVDLEWTREGGVELQGMSGSFRMRLPAPPVAQVVRQELMAAVAGVMPSTVQRVATRIDDPARDALLRDAGLVVGADGVRSVVRALVDARAAERIETPWVALRGLAPADESVAGAREFWGRGKLFGDAPVAGGRYWFSAHRSGLGPEPLDASLVLDEARRAFVGAARPVVTTLADARAADVLATRLWTAPPMRRYVRGRYVVIGDAAHASLPNIARGASDAVIDAVTLAEVLNRGGSPLAWQARRLPVTQAHRLVAGALMRCATSGVLG